MERDGKGYKLAKSQQKGFFIYTYKFLYIQGFFYIKLL